MALIAQWLERWPSEPEIPGSSPGGNSLFEFLIWEGKRRRRQTYEQEKEEEKRMSILSLSILGMSILSMSIPDKSRSTEEQGFAGPGGMGIFLV